MDGRNLRLRRGPWSGPRPLSRRGGGRGGTAAERPDRDRTFADRRNHLALVGQNRSPREGRRILAIVELVRLSRALTGRAESVGLAARRFWISASSASV